MRRRLRTLALAATVGTALAACGAAGLPSPAPRPTTEVVPVLSADQLDRILERIVPAVAAADAAKDANALVPVMDGPALTARTANYHLATADPSIAMPSSLGAERDSAVVPASQGWPRTAVVVTRDGAEDPLPEVLLLTQTAVREPYKLSAYASMIPRATFPVIPALRDGVDVVQPEDGTGLMMSPQDAVAGYATYLTEGAGSAQAERFAESPMTSAIIQSQDEARTALAPPSCPDCFTVTYTHTPNLENLWAFRTQDGGALVVARIDATTVMTSTGGAQTTLSQELRALSGRPILTSTGTFTYLQTVGLFIPLNGPQAKVSPVAFDRVAVSAAVDGAAATGPTPPVAPAPAAPAPAAPAPAAPPPGATP